MGSPPLRAAISGAVTRLCGTGLCADTPSSSLTRIASAARAPRRECARRGEALRYYLLLSGGSFKVLRQPPRRAQQAPIVAPRADELDAHGQAVDLEQRQRHRRHAEEG